MATKRASILADILTDLSAITGLTGGATMFKQEGTDLLYPHAILTWSTDSVLSEAPTRLFTRSLRILVGLCFQTDDASLQVTAEQAEEWIAKVEAAVMADRGRSGYAVDTKLVESALFPVLQEMPEVGVAVSFEVIYRAQSLT